MTTLHLLKRFDPAQLFRLFVDGRYHKKYDGWVGYEGGERGSVQALLNGFVHMLEHFDLTAGLKATYLLDLHKVCMMGVQTKNLKSSPGDLRYVNAGMPFYPKTTTLENLVEILEMRRGDGTAVFNTAAYAKPAEQLDAQELVAAMHRLGKINYRNWYPNLTEAEQTALAKNSGLQAFYEIKHRVQMQFVARVDDIVNRFNASMATVDGPEQRLRAIALLVRELELLHAFPDGNCRTVACVLLTQLLLNYEFTPALLDNPNLDGECSLDQWVGEIHKGMALFEVLLKDPAARVYDYAINDTSPENRALFARMSSELLQKLQLHQELFLTPERLLRYTGGHWHTACPEFVRFSGIGTYNTYGAGNLFFALEIVAWEKEGKDVRQALGTVVSKGARAIVLDRMEYADGWPVPVCIVPDAFTAFKAAAVAVRQELNPKTILITGTEGKTGAKVQLHHILNFQTHAHGVRNSANTEVPVLRSLAGLRVDDQLEINEVSVGSDEPYRVERAVMVNPDLCLFTHLGPNHMDLHKTMDNLLRAKSSVVEGLRDGGLCIVDADNPFSKGLEEAICTRKPQASIIHYGSSPDCTAQMLAFEFDTAQLGWRVKARIDADLVQYFVPLVPQHAPLASVGVLLAVKRLGFDVHRAAADYATLQPYETMGQISRLTKDGGEVLFYDQSRRGGISGMTSAFGDLQHIRPRGKVVALVGGISVLRDSDWTREVHQQLADLINQSPIDTLFTTGNYIDYVHAHLQRPVAKTSNDLEELSVLLAQAVQPGDLLFIIGSAYLYLGRVADRVRDILTNGYKPSTTLIANHLAAPSFRMLKVYESVASAVGAVKASASNGVTHTDYQAALKQYPDYAAYRGKLLQRLFDDLRQVLPTLHPMRCVDEDIRATDWATYVITSAFCRRWFNNLDKKPDVSSKQVFGRFFDFGDAQYLLHVNAATQNLHIGLVRCLREGDVLKPQAMSAEQAEDALLRYPGLRNSDVSHRNWGPKWLSRDLGRMIDLTNPESFLVAVDCENSPMFAQCIRPFVLALADPH